ncbi:putative phytanoyl- dioxygenase protein [Fonsecaea pedrosoi]|nr:putative phytanoyl- dioxygenase protein [Fonsecaea pedrosoi]
MSTGNNALAGTGGLRQPVHKDTRFRHPKCPFVIVANTALNDFTLENGATEFWLGSHAFTDERDQTVATPETVFGKQRIGTPSCPVLEEAIEARRAVRPPVRATMDKGDVMLRDFRTWHAGMPNATEQDRIMVAQIWMAPWYPNFITRLNLPLSQSEWFQSRANKLPMEIMANYIADDAVEFDQHRDNFSMEPSHYLDYYDTAPQNYRYD